MDRIESQARDYLSPREDQMTGKEYRDRDRDRDRDDGAHYPRSYAVGGRNRNGPF